ncbi:antibiotic biosynthesis monooxygenase [Shewanella colwelliana]|uniref:antibiotic biosynthesis monooxygenase family protein n=1 Tax=Shewanella colwelliana TaxID=23 RepID=UPI00299E620D|nr:antibiotic biosynthesis monooxygenase [Shewanella colwelliana]MDX1282045.1 antibiotic biosynthesis monooxygenase [Shewanella colwelliana]
MYAVIFRAKVANQDEAYSAMAVKMRQLAFEQYRCIDFVAVTEGDEEIAISYWHSEADILAWKQDCQHQVAQHSGQHNWYQSYQVQIVEVKRSYSSAV